MQGVDFATAISANDFITFTLTASHNSALGTGAVTITSGTVQASSGITLGNDFTIGALGGTGSVTTLQSWDFTGQNTAAATSSANVTAIGLNTDVAYNMLTRGATANASAATNSFRTSGFQNHGISTANTDYFQWQIASTGANAFSLSTLDARFAGTSTFRASPGVSAQFAYSLDNSTYTLIGSPFSLTADTAMPQIDLSGITALQGLGSNATITLRYYASGNTTTGGWGFNSSSAGQNGLELRGSVSGPGTGSATLGLTTAGTATYSGNLTIHGAATLTAATGATATFSGNFSGAGNLTKTGAGSVVLTGASSHTGGTTVSEGTLYSNGYLSGSVLVQTGATLGGSGTISGLATLNAGATLAPGNSVGTLTFEDGLTLNATSTVTMEINGAADFDRITVNGGLLTYGGTLSLLFGFTPAVNSTYQLFTGDAVATATGDFATLTFNDPAYQGSYNPDSGLLTLTAVPEPQTWALLGLGASFLLWQIRRRKNV
jgi:autotransporter-associated beta strand protein